jgi:hypothetical protein
MQIYLTFSLGECLLYDIRSRKPLLIKNTHNELAVKRLHYVRSADTSLVATLDEKVFV